MLAQRRHNCAAVCV